MTDSPALSHIDEGIFGSGTFGRPRGAAAQAVVVIAMLVAWVIFGFAARWLGVPELPHFDGSLFLGASPVSSLLIVAVLLIVCTLVCTIIAGCVRFEAGLFAACFGMIAISLRGGTTQSVLFESGCDPHVYSILAAEMFVLAAVVGLAWVMLWFMGRAGMIRPIPDHVPPEPIPSEGALAGTSALVAQAVATTILMMLFCQSQAKFQTLASVFISSAFGAMIAYGVFPARPSTWYWVGALLVGFVGYLLAASGQDAGLAIGVPQGYFAPLARPLPLDYASMGTAGAIFGYWTIRNRRV